MSGLEVIDGVGLYEIIIPAACFAVCIAFQTWEFVGDHDGGARARKLFEDVRAGWVKANYMTGQAAVNTTRDYIRAAVFFANSAILLTTFTVGYAGTLYTDCADEGGCSQEDWLLIIKLGVLGAELLVIFFVFTQCTRFAVHFSFCINVKELRGVPMPQSLMVNVFNHSHTYYSLGIRLYFGTIPIFAWIFTSWALLAVTPLYVYMVRGLENAGFVRDDLDAMERQRAAVPSAAAVAASSTQLDELQPRPPQGAALKQRVL